jgi:hypothetical protein
MEHGGYVETELYGAQDQASTGAIAVNAHPDRRSSRSIPVTRNTAFPEGVRSLAGPVWDRLLNTLRPIRPTATVRWTRSFRALQIRPP